MPGMTDNDLFGGDTVPAIAPRTAPAPVVQSLLPPPPQAAQPSGGNSGMAINNPLNLRPLSGGQWGGQNGVSPAGFASFADPASGWNAADQNLQAKLTKHGLTTIAGIIGDPTNGWAPAADHNNPQAYAATVAGALGVKPTDDISAQMADPAFRHKMLEQMAAVETGKPQTFGGAGAMPAGLTPEQQKIWSDLQVPGSGTDVFKGGGAVNQAQTTALQQIERDPARHFDPQALAGTPQNPWVMKPNSATPTGPGVHWVDQGGVEHINPGGLAEQAGSALAGLGQGAVMDTAASLSRLTNGAAGMAGLPPEEQAQMLAANPHTDFAASTQQGAAQQEQQYAQQHVADPYAQIGRFVGQAVPATAAALAVPELEAPTALSGVGRIGAQGATNALRGVAATAPSVGANPNQSVAGQLAGGALAGVAAPAVLGAPGKAFSALTGLGRTVSPEVATLADTAASKYGFAGPAALQSGQVVGADGDRGAATAYSNALSSDPKTLAVNKAQRKVWMKGVTGAYGDPSGDITPAAMEANQDRIGADIGAVAQRTSIPDAQTDIAAQLDERLAHARGVLGTDKLGPLQTLVDNIKSTIQPDGSMSGQSWAALTDKKSMLRGAINQGDSDYPNQVMQVMQDALAKNAPPADVAALRDARWQYKNWATVAKAVKSAGAGNIGPDGVLPQGALQSAVRSNFDNAATQGSGPLGDLLQIRGTFMREPPNSFTPARTANLLAPLKVGAEAAGLVGGGMALAQRPEAAIGAGLSALAGWAGKSGYQALQANKIGGAASNIISRSLPNAPRTVIGNALSGVGKVARPVEIPLSALAGVRGLGAMTQSPVTP